MVKIGIVGFSHPCFDHKVARELLQKHILRFVEQFQATPQEVEIVSGLTNVGIPKLAYEIAQEQQFVTVGISAKQAFEVKCGVFPVEKEFIYGEKFGDESEEFIAYIDCLIRVGGGKQSHKEVELFRQKHKNEIEDLLIETEI